ncbi:hypothetical protein G6F37_007901 [Rhizopus arrhizus]|nr:hypothetical protein G6F38_008033 [Rhizopus arrhizus]KAG1156120.1 hypothetical protein G6F37_007901 [Rhizopus arrhizus]
MSDVIKEGYLSVKEDGLRAWIWSKRYCVLRDQALTFHRNEQSGQCVALIFLKEITSVTRTDLKPYCFETATKDKTYYIACKNDEELYGWMDEIYNRSTVGASGPTNFVHEVHVGFDPNTGAFTGLPDQWTKLLKGSAITAEDAAKNPQAVLDVLEFYTEQTKREAEEYGSSNLQGAVERMSDDRWAALIQESKQTQMPPQRPAPPRPAPPPPNAKRPQDVHDMMNDLSIKTPKSPIDPRYPGYGQKSPARTTSISTYDDRIMQEREKLEVELLEREKKLKEQERIREQQLQKERERERQREQEIREREREKAAQQVSAPKKKVEQRISTMTEAQVMDQLRSVVTAGDPNELYKKLKRVGQGASGSVYVALSLATNTKVAIKQMDLSSQPRKDLIVTEILVMKESQHPNIVVL